MHDLRAWTPTLRLYLLELYCCAYGRRSASIPSEPIKTCWFYCKGFANLRNHDVASAHSALPLAVRSVIPHCNANITAKHAFTLVLIILSEAPLSGAGASTGISSFLLILCSRKIRLVSAVACRRTAELPFRLCLGENQCRRTESGLFEGHLWGKCRYKSKIPILLIFWNFL